MRMKKKDRASDNCIQWRLSRGWREALGMLSWHLTSNKGNTEDAVANNRVLDRLGPWQKAHNTTRGLTPGRRDPRVARDAPGNWISWPTSKGGKDWGKAQTTAFTDKIRKKPGPRKPKAPSNADADNKDHDEQLEATESEMEDDEANLEQSVTSSSAYTRPSSSASDRMDARMDSQPVQFPAQSIGLQHASDPRLAQHQMSQSTQDGTFGVLQQGYNNYHQPPSRPSALPTTRRSNPLAQQIRSSSTQPHQAALWDADASHNSSNRGAKRQIHELDMEEDKPDQQQAKKSRMQSSQADSASPSFQEVFSDMPDVMTMFRKSMAEKPHLYTKEAMAARKLQNQGPDATPDAMTRFRKHMAENPKLYTEEAKAVRKLQVQERDAGVATLMDGTANKRNGGQSGALQSVAMSQNRQIVSSDQPAESNPISLQGLAGGKGLRIAGGVAPHSRLENDGFLGSNQQGTSRTPPVSSRTSAVQRPQNSQPYFAVPGRAPVDRASMRPLPHVVGTKRQFDSLDTEDVPALHQQAKRTRQSDPQNTNGVSLSAEANAPVLNIRNETKGERAMTVHPSSQQALNSSQANRRQSSVPPSILDSGNAARPVPRNSQGQNFVMPTGQNTPVSSEGSGSSLYQSIPYPSDPGFYAVPALGSELEYGAPLTTPYQQAPYSSRIQNGSADGCINAAFLNPPMPSNITQSATTDHTFDLDIFTPSSIENSFDLDFEASTTTHSQPGISDDGPMATFLKADNFDFQMPEFDGSGDV